MREDCRLPGIIDWKNAFEKFHKIQKVKIVTEREAFILKVAFPNYDDPEKNNIVTKEITLQSLNESFSSSRYKYMPDIIRNLLIEWRPAVYLKDTLVAFFDIHAYSHFIENKSLSECKDVINRLFLNVEKNWGTGPRAAGIHLPYWIFSDSIILSIDTYIQPISRVQLRLFFATCSVIISGAMEYGLPLRGAIGGGNFYFSEGERILISTALSNAAKYEKAQEWLGVVITPEALSIIRKHDADFVMDDDIPKYVSYGQVPWKTGERMDAPEESYYIKPLMSNPKWKDYLPSYFDGSPKFSASSFEDRSAVETLCRAIIDDQFKIQLPLERLNRYLIETFYPAKTKGHYKKIENSHELYT